MVLSLGGERESVCENVGHCRWWIKTKEAVSPQRDHDQGKYSRTPTQGSHGTRPWGLGWGSTLRRVTLGYKELHTLTVKFQKCQSWMASKFSTHQSLNLLKLLEGLLTVLR